MLVCIFVSVYRLSGESYSTSCLNNVSLDMKCFLERTLNRLHIFQYVPYHLFNSFITTRDYLHAQWAKFIMQEDGRPFEPIRTPRWFLPPPIVEPQNGGNRVNTDIAEALSLQLTASVEIVVGVCAPISRGDKIKVRLISTRRNINMLTIFVIIGALLATQSVAIIR